MAVVEQKPSWVWGRHSPLGLGIAALVVIADQAHKAWMLGPYQIQSKGRVAITPFLDLVYVKNEGISYGLFADQAQLIWITLAVLAVVGMACWLAYGITAKLAAAGVGLIMGGAASNAVDRVALGGVADFFSLHALGFYWYVFNLADLAIVAGVAGLLYDSFVASRNDASKGL
jgi:signal peptidase II